MLMLDLLATATSTPLYWSDLGLKPGIDLGFFTLRFYSLAYLAGILLGYWHLSKMVKAPGAPLAQRHADDLFFYCTLGIIIGGRLGYATFYQRELWTSLDLFKLWEGGMSFHGGLIGTTLAIALVCWQGRLNFIRVCDYVAVNIGFGMLFGRLANFVNGELWGRPAGTDVPWAMIFPGGGDVVRHPSQLYQAGLEGIALGLILSFLFWKTDARYKPGYLAGQFLLWMGVFRFASETVREPDAGVYGLFGMTMGQTLCAPLIVLGLYLIFTAKGRRERVESVAGQQSVA